MCFRLVFTSLLEALVLGLVAEKEALRAKGRASVGSGPTTWLPGAQGPTPLKENVAAAARSVAPAWRSVSTRWAALATAAASPAS